MTIVNPLAASPMVVQATLATGRPEERQNELRVEQVVRATVVEGGLDRAILDLNHQRFRIQTEQQLLTGQQLELQVLTTHPKLTFKLLSLPWETKLAALLPLLAKPFDWGGLLQQVQQGAAPRSESLQQVLTQLSGLLAPQAGLTADGLAALVSTLGHLRDSAPLFSGTNGSALALAFDQVFKTLIQQGGSQDLPQQLKAVALQIRQEPALLSEVMVVGEGKVARLLSKMEQSGQPLSLDKAHQLARELRAALATGTAPLSRRLDQVFKPLIQQGGSWDLPRQLKAIASQIRREPALMSEVMAVGEGTVARLLSRMEQPAQPLRLDQAHQLARELRTTLSRSGAPLSQLLANSIPELRLFLNPPQGHDPVAPPVLLGQIKEFVDQLRLAAAEKPDWSVGLRQLVQHTLEMMRPLTAEPEVLTGGRQLGLLSQLLGLNLEAELLRGRTRDALSSLKMALLGETPGLGAKGEEALHRLELFQVCRVRLAEQNLNFIPLPLAFLEEGFLLVEDDGRSEQEQGKEGGAMRISLYLRLSSLGNLRIDMLSETSGMLLRVACEDQVRADFLRSMSEQLQERLRELPVISVNFTTGVESPAGELLKKLLPHSRGMLDARV